MRERMGRLSSGVRALRGVGATFALTGAIALGAGACTTGDEAEPTFVPPTAGEIQPEQAPTDDAAASPLGGEGGAQTGDRAAELAEAAGTASVMVIEDWDAFGSADEVEDTIERNLGMGDTTMDLSLETSAGGDLPAGTVLVMAYDIQADAPHDFVGFDRDLDDEADWQAASEVVIWLDGAQATGVNAVFQFREASGEVWRFEGPMPEDGSPLRIALDAETFRWADWSTTENGEIDLDTVNRYGLYVGHQGPGLSGMVRFGPIVAVP